MTTLEKIKGKTYRIDIEELILRLTLELKINRLETKEQKEIANQFLYFAIYSAVLLILDITNLKKVDDSIYGTLIEMSKDYWHLNKYDRLVKGNDDENEENNNMEVSSIKEGDTQVNFSSKSNTININGTTYSTGTINFDENILREKYKTALYGHRVLRWGA